MLKEGFCHNPTNHAMSRITAIIEEWINEAKVSTPVSIYYDDVTETFNIFSADPGYLIGFGGNLLEKYRKKLLAMGLKNIEIKEVAVITKSDSGNENNRSNVSRKTLSKFLLEDTAVNELCAIRFCGYIVATVYIDYEDLWTVSNSLCEKVVVNDEYGSLNIAGNNDAVKVHYIDII